MSKPIEITVKESASELQKLYKSAAVHLRSRYKMLLSIHTGIHNNTELGSKTGVSLRSIIRWKKIYQLGGLKSLVTDGRGGDHRSDIDSVSKEKIREKLSQPTEAFTSYIAAQEWINKEFGLDMKYQAINKYLKRNFGTKLKVGRKSHVEKDPEAVAVFKNPARKP